MFTFLKFFINDYKISFSLPRIYRLKISASRDHSFVLLLVISFIGVVQSATITCNSFPKIFGGSSGDTFVLQIDVYNDYLALAGGT